MKNIETGIENIIDNAQQVCNELIKLLEKENQSLIEGETSLLSTIVNEKSILLKQLADHETNLNKELTISVSINPDSQEDNINDYIQLQNMPKWANFLESVSRCRALNNRNGYIVNIALANTHKSLSILHGHEQNEGDTYNINGKDSRKFAARTIAKI